MYSSDQRFSSRVIRLGTAVALGGLLSTTVVVGADATTTVSVAGLKAQAALTAAKAKGSVHYRQREFSGQLDEEITADIGPSSGVQNVTLTIGKTKGSLTAKLVAGIVYVNGSAFALHGVLGFTTSAASKVAGKWMAVTSSAPQYPEFAVGLSMPSLIDELQITGTVSSLGTTTIAGKTLVRLEGSVPSSAASPSAQETLFVPTSGAPLPVQSLEILAVGQGAFVFSNWGKSVTVTAPTKSISFSPKYIATISS